MMKFFGGRQEEIGKFLPVLVVTFNIIFLQKMVAFCYGIYFSGYVDRKPFVVYELCEVCPINQTLRYQIQPELCTTKEIGRDCHDVACQMHAKNIISVCLGDGSCGRPYTLQPGSFALRPFQTCRNESKWQKHC